jgi:hypothetical protein
MNFALGSLSATTMDTHLTTPQLPRFLVAMAGVALMLGGLFAGMLGGYVMTGDCGARGSLDGLWLVVPGILAMVGGVILIAQALRR